MLTAGVGCRAGGPLVCRATQFGRRRRAPHRARAGQGPSPAVCAWGVCVLSGCRWCGRRRPSSGGPGVSCPGVVGSVIGIGGSGGLGAGGPFVSFSATSGPGAAGPGVGVPGAHVSGVSGLGVGGAGVSGPGVCGPGVGAPEGSRRAPVALEGTCRDPAPQGYPSCSYDPRGHLSRPCDPRGYLLPTCDHRGRLPQGAPLLGQAVHPCVYVHSPAVGGSMLIASCVCGTGGLHSCRAPSAVRASAARVSGFWVPVMRVMAFRMPRVSTVWARAVWPLSSRAYRRSGCGRCSRCRPGYRGPVCQWSGCRRFMYRWRWCQRPGWSRRGRQWSG